MKRFILTTIVFFCVPSFATDFLQPSYSAMVSGSVTPIPKNAPVGVFSTTYFDAEYATATIYGVEQDQIQRRMGAQVTNRNDNIPIGTAVFGNEVLFDLSWTVLGTTYKNREYTQSYLIDRRQPNPVNNCDGYEFRVDERDPSTYWLSEPNFSPSGSRMAFNAACLPPLLARYQDFHRNHLRVFDRKTGVQQSDIANIDEIHWRSDDELLGVHVFDFRHPQSQDPTGVYKINLTDNTKTLILPTRTNDLTDDMVLFGSASQNFVVVNDAVQLVAQEYSIENGALVKSHAISFPNCDHVQISVAAKPYVVLSNDGKRLLVPRPICRTKSGSVESLPPFIYDFEQNKMVWIDTEEMIVGNAHVTYLPKLDIFTILPVGGAEKGYPNGQERVAFVNMTTLDVQTTLLACDPAQYSQTNVVYVFQSSKTGLGLDTTCFDRKTKHLYHYVFGFEPKN